MKTKYFIFALLPVCINLQCNKLDISLHTAIVLNQTCPVENLNEMAVELNYKGPLSFSYTNPSTGTVYKNVVVTFSAVMRQSIGI